MCLRLFVGVLAVLFTFACMGVLGKRVNPLWLIGGFFVIRIAGDTVGLLGQ
ncbi:PTS system mannose/fructose/sorbose family transporter subunit IID [Salmonella enterica]|uniref:PTS system mannose/fructose/sorbose family transporter subunit IID n=1 Tax=Salmonella enterica TaxID=28901 RepID=UPI00398C5062